MKAFLFLLCLLCVRPAQAQDVVIIGEVHDNPAHHQVQAAMTAEIAPAALVFEMLTGDQAARVTDDTRTSPETLEQVLGWTASGWPDFAMYYPIFAAAPAAGIYGANVPGPSAWGDNAGGLKAYLEQVRAEYALDTPLPADEQSAREALQMAAHCGALPPEALPGMVAFQRLRDAVLADTTRQALADTGGPVVVITGNGHARRDWGVPAFLSGRLPDVQIKVIGQTEENAPLEGGFDQVISAPAALRPDPCLAFR